MDTTKATPKQEAEWDAAYNAGHLNAALNRRFLSGRESERKRTAEIERLAGELAQATINEHVDGLDREDLRFRKAFELQAAIARGK